MQQVIKHYKTLFVCWFIMKTMPGPGFPTSHVVVSIVFSELSYHERWLFVFVDSGGIDYHHCL